MNDFLIYVLICFNLQVLDLHNNDLQILPDDICHLERLQVSKLIDVSFDF